MAMAMAILRLALALALVSWTRDDLEYDYRLRFLILYSCLLLAS